ncbi:MAG: hypothetical protein K2J20_06510 [Bacilli bacterium]|nr:hypothetical protein [Bacilli bacterium]
MKETVLKNNNKLPYTLHDMRISKIIIEENDINLIFENGYVENKEPFKQIEGSVIIKEVDYDFCSIHLLSRNGKYGKFVGRKIGFKEFIEKFKKYSFEVVDELYGFNQVQYSGFLMLSNAKDFIEYSMNFYYTGDLIYLTKE